MTTGAYGTGNLNPTNVVALKTFLDTVAPWVAFDPYINMVKAPENEGETFLLSRPVIPDADINPSIEGVNKTPRQLVLEQSQCTAQEFEEAFMFTSRQMELGEFGKQIIAKTREVLTGLIAKNRERYRWSVYRANDNVYYNSPSVSARNQVNGPITRGRIDKALAFLHNNEATYVTAAASGAMQEGTVPMPEAYVGFGHTDLLPDFQDLSGWKEIVEVGGLKVGSIHARGMLHRLLVVLTPHFVQFADSGAAVGSTGMKSTSGTSIDVYPFLITGKLGLSDLSFGKMSGDAAVKINVLRPDQIDKSDYSGKRGYISARYYQAPVVTRQAEVLRIEVGCTANPA